jgi:hypothetical protein
MANSSSQPPLTDAERQFDWTALSPLGGQTAHIRFVGKFHGRHVTWDTHLITLQEIYQQGIAAGTFAADKPISLFQFIEIDETGPAEMTLKIGINVSAIDAPTVFKSMIMIHNYKRLRIGRHEYGPPRQFS